MNQLFSAFGILCALFGLSIGFQACDTDDEPTDCICPQVVAPVCVVDGDNTLTFSNGCYAECAGFSPDEYAACNSGSDCVCYEIFAPVCVATPSGQILEFPNDCYAECAGYDASIYYDCADTDTTATGCQCPEIYDPVCVATPGGGQILVFDNACFAECEGYDDSVYYSCDGQTVNCNEPVAPTIAIDNNPICQPGTGQPVNATLSSPSELPDGFNYQWQLDGENISPASGGSDQTITTSLIGTYTLIFTDGGDCASPVSNEIALTETDCSPVTAACPNGVIGEVEDLTGLSGCGLVINIDGQAHEPAILPDGVQLEAGKTVRLEFVVNTDFASICMVGPIIEVSCLEVL